ncbi:uncharacterized protein DNG_09281 [Cephalotrichum gorgonifer]|uniref:Amidohydrolase-related domain-containing protein n=1 Tax=Cephalotrichum gorgonifer TaxID=2041049 RepID=A0AAE8N5D3_9PEZI|nr:uncharacterized protein DNG_09281 [Cephalotrichum gorgonifer]
MSVNQAFLLATRSGAQALRRPDLGVLKVGATADIVVFDGTATNLIGWRDPVAASSFTLTLATSSMFSWTASSPPRPTAVYIINLLSIFPAFDILVTPT